MYKAYGVMNFVKLKFSESEVFEIAYILQRRHGNNLSICRCILLWKILINLID